MNERKIRRQFAKPTETEAIGRVDRKLFRDGQEKVIADLKARYRELRKIDPQAAAEVKREIKQRRAHMYSPRNPQPNLSRIAS